MMVVVFWIGRDNTGVPCTWIDIRCPWIRNLAFAKQTSFVLIQCVRFLYSSFTSYPRCLWSSEKRSFARAVRSHAAGKGNVTQGHAFTLFIFGDQAILLIRLIRPVVNRRKGGFSSAIITR